MRLIPSVAEATAPLSKRGAKRTPHLSQGPAPGLLGGPQTCTRFGYVVGATLAVARAVRSWFAGRFGEYARRRVFFLFACPKRKKQRETTLGRGRLRFLPLPRPTLIETPKRGDPLLDLPRAVRIRPGVLHLPGFPARRLTIGSPSGGAVELSETEGGSHRRYGFARGFCVSQVSPPGIRASPSGGGVCAADGGGATPPGGDKPRPYMGTEGYTTRRGDSRIARRSRPSRRGRRPGWPTCEALRHQQNDGV